MQKFSILDVWQGPRYASGRTMKIGIVVLSDKKHNLVHIENYILAFSPYPPFCTTDMVPWVCICHILIKSFCTNSKLHSVVTLFLKSLNFFNYPQKKKLHRVKSGEQGGHSTFIYAYQVNTSLARTKISFLNIFTSQDLI